MFWIFFLDQSFYWFLLFARRRLTIQAYFPNLNTGTYERVCARVCVRVSMYVCFVVWIPMALYPYFNINFGWNLVFLKFSFPSGTMKSYIIWNSHFHSKIFFCIFTWEIYLEKKYIFLSDEWYLLTREKT